MNNKTVPTIFGKGWRTDLAFWLAYGLLGHFIYAPEWLTLSNLTISFLLYGWTAAASYAHLTWLLEPRLDKRISPLRYVAGLVPLVLLAGGLCLGSLYGFFLVALPPAAARQFALTAYTFWAGAVLGSTIMGVAITGAIYLFKRRREEDKRTRALEQARTESELAYLRGQLNPHFLFNALNSIYFLIPRSPAEAQTALGGFSELLRYQLYRSEAELVPLGEELEQLRKFVALSRLRLEEDFVFALREPPEAARYQLPPLLLLPLMENAVKYSPAEGGRVTGLVEVRADRLHFSLTNRTGGEPAANVPASAVGAGGIGLANIRRRLDLLYPDDYVFEHHAAADHYTVTLAIPLTPCPSSAPSS